MATNEYLSIITLNVNGLNALRHRAAECIKNMIQYILPTRDVSQKKKKGPTHTENKGLK